MRGAFFLAVRPTAIDANWRFNVGFVTGAQNFDVVSLGDVVTDEFIRLPDGPVRVRADDEGRWLEIPLGTKLAVGDDSSTSVGGSAANAAVAMSRLGLRVGLASYLAHDQIGLDILSAMRGEGVGTDLVHVDSPSHTVRNFVLSFGGERTILVRHSEFNYDWKGFRDHDLPTWLYVNSLGPDALKYQDELADWLGARPNVRLAFQPGTFQVEAGTKRLHRMYERAEVLLCSRAAAEQITGLASGDVNEMLNALRKLGPRNVVVFDETGGAVAANEVGRFSIAEFPDPDPPLDTTGTGDAFAATLVAALITGMPLREALRWPPVNAASVSRHFGTQGGLLRLDDLVTRLDAVPEFVTQDQ
jgi:sugar/nucleoside kinase (ribokinase family)